MKAHLPSFRDRWMPAMAVLALLLTHRAFAIDLLVYNNNDAGAGSLRQAVADNNALGGGNTIIFSNNVAGSITLTSGELMITRDVTIVGPGSKVLAVSGNAASRVFNITNSTVSISSLAITNGYANNYGGGIYNVNSKLTLNNCTLNGNSAVYGGGINNFANGGFATVTINSSTLSGNRASGGGGGIYNVELFGRATVTISASTLSSNSAVNFGGAVYNEGGIIEAVVTISASTLSGNSATSGGGIYNYGSSSNTAPIEIGDTILKAGSSGANIVNGAYGAVISRGYNLSSDNGGGFLTALGDQTNTDPLLGLLQDNDGPTPTMVPLPGSPAIDQGKRDAITTLAINIDQRGRNRPFTNAIPPATLGDHSDIGAVEISPIIVSNTNDSGPGSLRQAIQDASPSDANAVTFGTNVRGVIALTSGELLIGKSLSIVGPCAKQLAISGNNASRVFEVTNGTVRVSGLSIVNGNAAGLTGRGGGILQTGGTLFLDQCRIASNSAAIGGGIDMLGGTLVISNSAICYNQCFSTGVGGGGTEPDGGGIATEITSANLTIINSTISGNTISASGGSTLGGGIYSTGPLQMTNCTVANNTSMSFAGGIRRATSTARLANCIIAGNSAPSFPDVSGTFVSDGYNLIGNTSGGSGFGTTGDLLNTNAQLGPLADNGGCTPTHALLSGSPALDKGKGLGLTTDQRGAPRPFDFAAIANASGGDGSDIGAFESGSPPLNIQKVGSSAVLSWPWHYGGFTLESVTNLPASNNWSAVPGTPVVVGDQFNVTNGPTSGNKFFRLRGN